MADIKIDEELLLRAGLGIGYAFAPFFRGILEGVEDYTIEQAAREMQEEHDAQEAEEGLKRPVEKTLIGDCRKCWCDQCAKLEQCVHLREGALPDGVRPFPCVGCADGMRFKPCEEERCADFEQGAGNTPAWLVAVSGFLLGALFLWGSDRKSTRLNSSH